jgi:hypothetical protein
MEGIEWMNRYERMNEWIGDELFLGSSDGFEILLNIEGQGEKI